MILSLARGNILRRKKHTHDGSRSGFPWFAARGKRDAAGEPVKQEEHQPEQEGGTPNPAADLPTLDERERNVLHRVGHAWGRVCTNPEVWRQALPINPDPGHYPPLQDLRSNRFEQFVRVSQRDAVEATQAAEEPTSWIGRSGSQLRHILLGAPLRSTALVQERMRKLAALPVLSADALSSIAHGPEAMLTILVLAGSAGLNYTFPIAAAIAFLMFAVGVSYRQTIRAYPHGGGSYIVANENLGHLPGLAAAAGLMADYILTVAISIASGVAAITSAIPPLAPATVLIGILAIIVFMLVALRIRHHYKLVKEALQLRPGAIEVPKYALSPALREQKGHNHEAVAQEEESADDTTSAEETPEALHHLTLVPLAALAYAASLQQPVLALHLSPTKEEAERFRAYWQVWGDHLPLEVVVSPYRVLVAPLIHYIELVHKQCPDLTVTVILPEIVVRHWWHRLLHNRTASRLRRSLRPLPKIVVTTVPFHLSR